MIPFLGKFMSFVWAIFSNVIEGISSVGLKAIKNYSKTHKLSEWDLSKNIIYIFCNKSVNLINLINIA